MALRLSGLGPWLATVIHVLDGHVTLDTRDKRLSSHNMTYLLTYIIYKYIHIMYKSRFNYSLLNLDNPDL